jgi:hypothetical protein
MDPALAPPRRRPGWPSTRGRAGARSTVLAAALWSLDRVEEARASAQAAIAALEPTGDLPELARAHAAYVRMEAGRLRPRDRDRCRPGRARAGRARGRRRGPGRPWRSASPWPTATAASRRVRAARERARRRGRRRAAHPGRPLLRQRPGGSPPTRATTRRVDALAPEALALFEARAAHARGVRTVCWRAACWTAGAGTTRSSAPRPAAAAGTAASRWRTWSRARRACARAAAGRAARRGRGAFWPASRRRAPRARPARRSPRPAWLTRLIARAMREHALAGLRAPARRAVRAVGGELALWARAGGATVDAPARMPEPVRLEALRRLAGRRRRMARAPSAVRGRPRALPGDDRAAREAVAALHRLGASAAARAFARDRAEQGAAAPARAPAVDAQQPRRPHAPRAGGARARRGRRHQRDIARALHLSSAPSSTRLRDPRHSSAPPPAPARCRRRATWVAPRPKMGDRADPARQSRT